jgi:hypothetical protein
MPASTTSDAEGAIRAVVARLSRPDGEGAVVIERAAIVAEGLNAAAIEEWIVTHGGEPEAPVVRPPHPGLYGSRNDTFAGRFGARPPRRYVVPAAALGMKR